MLLAAAAAEVVLNVTAPQQRAKWVHGHMVLRYYSANSANTLYVYVKCVYLRHCWWLRSYSVGDRWMNDMKYWWKDTGGENRSTGRKIHPRALSPPQIPQSEVPAARGVSLGVTWHFTRTFQVWLLQNTRLLNSAVNTSGISVRLYPWKLRLDTAHHTLSDIKCDSLGSCG